ncbi:MAG: DUF2182 domain-containing protein [Gammaproteobacteria bacterium]
MPAKTTLEALLKRDRLVVIAALVLVTAISWVYLLAGAGMGMSALEMTRMSQQGAAGGMSESMDTMSMLSPVVWTPEYAVLMFFMWWIMMVAMMLPSAAPMILLFATINRKQRESGHPHVATGVFAIGYLAVWAGFSTIAVTLQWMFQRADILSPMLVGNNAIFGGILLFAAGLYQLTPVKRACLRHCRSPIAYLSTQWRRGIRGALRMGAVHGTFCVGCCWFLMGLLFFGGVMNLYWIIGLAVFVLFEKTVPLGHWLEYASGIALVVWGATTLTPAILSVYAT